MENTQLLLNELELTANSIMLKNKNFTITKIQALELAVKIQANDIALQRNKILQNFNDSFDSTSFYE